MAQPEKTNAGKFTKELMKEFKGWYQRINDIPFGAHAEKKLFDGVFTSKGIAFEFKFKDGGATFNLDTEWRDREPHQEIGLRKFQDSGAGHGILLIFWKRKNRIHVCWHLVGDIIGIDKIPFDEWRDKEQLFSLISQY